MGINSSRINSYLFLFGLRLDFAGFELISIAPHYDPYCAILGATSCLLVLGSTCSVTQ
ncbi:hypothetical protein HAX54_002723, partial [Datura stramonium]|nr:hypothetical protein [Datura stramonium]